MKTRIYFYFRCFYSFFSNIKTQNNEKIFFFIHLKVFYLNHSANQTFRLFLTIFLAFYVHCKKKICSTEPSKKVPAISKSVRRGPEFQKRDKKIYETFKGSSRLSRERTFSYETIFKFRTGEKSLYKTFRVSYYPLMVSY